MFCQDSLHESTAIYNTQLCLTIHILTTWEILHIISQLGKILHVILFLDKAKFGHRRKGLFFFNLQIRLDLYKCAIDRMNQTILCEITKICKNPSKHENMSKFWDDYKKVPALIWKWNNMAETIL